MGGYRVDMPELGRFITDLSTAAEKISEANKRLREAELSARGNADIEKAGKDFQESWEYGTGKLAETTDKVTGLLRAAKEHYAQLEEEVSELFQAHTQALSDSTAPDSKIMSALEGTE